MDNFNPLSNLTPIPARAGNCIAEAMALRERNSYRGDVFFVYLMGEREVIQSFYVPNPAELDALALNQADNGYDIDPPLTVREVLSHGHRLSPPIDLRPLSVVLGELIGSYQQAVRDHVI